MDKATPGLEIKAVSERTGVSVHALRAWERRYGVPHPTRSPGNRYRVYHESDIADVQWMKQRIATGVSPAQASLLLLQQRRSESAASPASQTSLEETRAAFQFAALASNETAARQILDEAFALFTLEQVALQIIQPTMAEIGTRWMRKEVSVWQEHLVSNLVRQKLVAVLQAQPAPLPFARQVIAACAPGEEHELGLLILALLVSRQGWRTTYLGRGTPLEDILRLARASSPQAVLISATTVVGLSNLIPILAKENRVGVPMAFGGRLLDLLPTLREHMPGTYLGQDPIAGVRSLGALTPPSVYWSPSKRAWSAVMALRARRIQIAGDVVADLAPARGSETERLATSRQLAFGTLYLVDVLSCALALDTPELIDLHREWLTDAMPTRAVSAHALTAHREAVTRVLGKLLSPEEARPFKALLSRLEANV